MADRKLFGLSPVDRAIAEARQRYSGISGMPQLDRPGQTPESEPLEGPQATTDNLHVPGSSQSLAPPKQLQPLFEDAARKHQVPVNVLMALAQQESSYDVQATGKVPTKYGRAQGIMQYIPPTARSLGINPYDPVQAINAAAKQLKERLDKGYSMEDAVKEHFAGTDRKGWGPLTREYGTKVLAKARAIRAELYSQPQQQESADFDSMISGRERTQGNMSVMADGPMSVPTGTDMRDVRDVARIPETLPEPQQSWEDRSWFERYVTDRLGAGWKGLQAGMASNAAGFDGRILDVIDRIDRGEQVQDMDDPLGYQYMNAEQRAQAKQQVGDAFIKSLGDTARLNKEQQAIPQHPEVQAALQSETFSEFWDHFSKAPVTFITSVGLESLPQMAPGLVMGGAAGALTRTAGGFAAGMGAGSYATDYAASVLQALGENGIDVTNQEQLQKAFQDKTLMEQVRKSAHAHASVVGTADAVSGGLAGKAIISGSTVGRKMANTAAQMPAQGALGAGGEVGGQLAQGKRPEDIKAGEVAAEFFGEMATAPIDVAAAGLAARREQRQQDQQPDPQADTAPAQRAPLALPPPTIEVGPDGTATTASQRNAQRNAESIGREAEARRRYQTGQDGRVTPYEATDGVVVSEDGQILAPGATAWSPEQQPIDTRGPLTRAMDKGVEAAQQQAAASEQAAVENGLPPVGTQVVLDPGTGEAIPAVVAEYVGNEIVFQDQTGNALQIPIPEALQVMRLPEQIDPETGEVQDGEIVSGDATVLPDVRGSGVEDTQKVRTDQPQGTQAGGEVSGGRQGASEVDGTGVGENLVAATGPAEQPRTLNIEDMTLEQLQERRQYISDQARASGGWNKTLVQERDRVDAAINRIEAGNVQAPKDVKPRPTNVTTQGGKPLVELYHSREGVKVLVRKDQWEDGRADLPTFNSEGKRQSGTLMNVPRSLLRTPEQEADVTEQADAVIDSQAFVEPDVIPESAYVEGEAAQQTQPAPASEQPAPTEDERLAGKRNLYKAIKDSGAPDDVAANSVVNAQFKANESGTPMSVWRHRESGTIGIVPEGQKSPLNNADLVATIYPDAPTANEAPAAERQAPSEQQSTVERAKPKKASKEDLERLFGIDQKRAKALERIAKGRAWFGDQQKARDFITKNGLKDTHEAVQTGAKRWEAQLAENKRVSAEERAKKDALVERIKSGAELTEADLRLIGLRPGASDLRWFIPAAADLFGIGSRSVRPYIKDLIRTVSNDMGTKREVVAPKKALKAIADGMAGIQPEQQAEQPQANTDATPERQSGNDFLTELFGEQAPQSGVASNANTATQQHDAKQLGRILDQAKKDAQDREADWSSRKYKENRSQIELQGDGPRSGSSMSVSAANEARRDRNVKAARDEIAAIESLQKMLSTPQGERRLLNNLDAAMAEAKRQIDSGTSILPNATVDSVFEYNILQGLNISPATGAYTSTPVSQALLEYMKGQEVQANPGQQNRIEDAGANLYWNRKNPWRSGGLTWDDVKGENETLRTKLVTKAKVWAKPDWEAYLSNVPEQMRQAATVAARIVKGIYDAIPASPKSGEDAALKAYIDAVTEVREAADAFLKDDDAIKNFVATWAQRGSRVLSTGPVSVMDMVKGDSAAQKALAQPIMAAVFPQSIDKRSFVEAERPKARTLGNKAVSAMQTSTQDLVKAMKDISAGWPAPQEAWQRQGYKVFPKEGAQVKQAYGDKYSLVIAGRGRIFDSQAEAQEYIDTFKDFILVDKYGRIEGSYDTEEAAIEGARNKTKREGGKRRELETGFSMDEVRREGPARRTGDVTPERLMEDFGFRGVNFGKYVKQDQRQTHLNAAYDAFYDLAEVLGVPTKALSLNGMLGIAFGAQGSGKALAHFVPGVNEINITRDNGAGSLAHEWGHALDHYFATMAGLGREKSPFLSEHAGQGATRKRYSQRDGKMVSEEVNRFTDDIRPEIVKAFETIAKRMNKVELTKAEFEASLQNAIKRSRDKLSSVIEQLGLESKAMTPEAKAMLETLKKGEAGAYVKLDPKSRKSMPDMVGKTVKDFSDAAGLDMRDTKLLHDAVVSIGYSKDRLSAERTHIPQRTTDYAKGSAEADRGSSKPYWSTDVEMYARAFETFVHDELSAREVTNNYLVRNYDSEVYPQGEDRTALNEAFKSLVNAIEVDDNNVMYSVAPQTETAAFKRWFGDSKVVDADGNPLVVYHGTGADITEFDPTRTALADGVFVTPDANYASVFAEDSARFGRDGSPNVMPMYARIEKPAYIEANEFTQGTFQDTATRGDIDGIIVRNEDGSIHSAFVFESSQLKSATGNIGTFDPANPDITMSVGDAQADAQPAMAALQSGPVGSVITRLVDNGNIVIHTDASTLPAAAKDKKVQGYTDKDGRVHLVAPNLNQRNALAVALHEAFHGFGEKLIGTKRWNEMLRRMDGYLQAARKRQSEGRGTSGDFHDQVLSRLDSAIAQNAVSKGREAEEFAAYTIELYEQAPQGIKKWIDTFVGMVKDWLARRFNLQVGEITPAQLRAFAVAALRSAEGTMPQINASLGGSAIGSGALSTQSRGTDSPAFKRWFGDSKVVDADGKPLVVYHGTASDFGVFSESRGNGYYFTDDSSAASAYAQYALADEDSAAGPNVVPAYLSIQNPLILDAEWQRENMEAGGEWDWEVLDNALYSAEEAGHDGAILRGFMDYSGLVDGKRSERRYDQYIAFRPEQIKSATGNIGTFDLDNADIRFSVSDNEPRLTHQTIIERLSDGLDNMKPSVLAAIPLNYFEELARPAMKDAVKAYMKLKRSMDAYRGERHAEADQTAQKWLKLRAFNRQEAKELATLMHDSTLRQVDPSTSKEDPDLSKRYSNLSTEAKALYKEVRDAYRKQSDELDSILVENIKNAMDLAVAQAERRYNERMQQIKDEGLKGAEREAAEAAAEKAFKTASTKARWSRNARVTALRKSFESNRLAGPYFPLARFGNYFVTVRDVDGSVISFSRKETVGQMRRLAQDMAAAYPTATIETGMLSNKSEVEGAIDPRFVVEIEEILGDAAVDDEVRDQIWQRYLESMPDMSARKRFIHRKGTEGYENDALRAFSNHMFHAAHQMARLKFGPQMLEQVNKVEDSARASDDPVRGMQLSNEMRRRHKWVMNPTGSSVAQTMTSTAFVWYLGLTPAAAAVNTSQTVLLGVPIIGARYGLANAQAQLLRAFKDFAIGKGSVKGANLTADERAAMQEAYNSGLIDKSQAHDLAGVGDTGVQYSAVRQKVMGTVAFLFHQAERLNREVTALAAYRAARDAGKTHQQAVDEAHELTWKTHFDYSNSNRPRIMQNDFAKVALVFRNFQINMLYRLFRDIHQSFRGETPQARKEARYQLVGIMGMMALNAGVKGLPFYSLAMILMGLAFDDDDEPFTFEERMRTATIDALGPELGGMLLNGVPGHYLGIDLTNRIGMPDLWFRSPNRDLQGADEYQYWLSQALGAVPAIGESIWRGTQIAIDGNVARGIETASPKFVKDMLKSWRFSQEGATTLKGESYLGPDDITTWNKVAQAIGFTPAALVETYERNNALKNAEQRILNQRRKLLNEFALSRKLGDDEANSKVRDRIREFNQSFPRVRITGETLTQSLRARRNTSRRTQDGIIIDKRLDRELRRGMPEFIYRGESR